MKARTSHAGVVGVFPDRASAERSIHDLRQAGFRNDQIGMVTRDAGGRTVKTNGAGEETNAGEGAAIGAAAGAAAGAAVGAGIVAGVVPVLGPVLALGTLGTILVNAAGGAAIAGLVGALVGWGVPEEDAKYYESEVHAGRYLVTVSDTDRRDEAWAILHRFGAYNRETAPVAATTSSTTTAANRQVELKEEQLRVNKTPVKKGEVEVRKEVITEHKQITVPVEREEVVIERRPAGGRAAAGAVKSEEIRIPVKEEKVNVSKDTVVKEEVAVGKRKVRDTANVGGTVRKEELKVEETGDVEVRGDTSRRSRK